MQMFSHAQQIDLALLFRSLAFCRSDKRHAWVRLISHSGDGYVQLTALVVFWLINTTESNRLLTVLCIALIIERALYLVLKNTLRRPRPYDCVPTVVCKVSASDRFSLPSGHTSASFLMMVIAFNISIMLGILSLVWAVLVGFSRVGMGVHFPSDIVAGAFLGTIVGLYTLSWVESSNLVF